MKEKNITDLIFNLISDYEQDNEEKPSKVLVGTPEYKILIDFCRNHYMSGENLVINGVPVEHTPKLAGVQIQRTNSVRFLID